MSEQYKGGESLDAKLARLNAAMNEGMNATPEDRSNKANSEIGITDLGQRASQLNRGPYSDVSPQHAPKGPLGGGPKQSSGDASLNYADKMAGLKEGAISSLNTLASQHNMNPYDIKRLLAQISKVSPVDNTPIIFSNNNARNTFVDNIARSNPGIDKNGLSRALQAPTMTLGRLGQQVKYLV